MTDPGKKPVIFISYSHKDAKLLEALEPHLFAELKKHSRANILEIFVDKRRLVAGDKWHDEITGALSRSVVGVLLLSVHFMNSEYIYGSELQELLKRGDLCRIAPIYGSTANVKDSSVTIEVDGREVPVELGDYHALNEPESPLLALQGDALEAACADIAAKIFRLAEEQLSKQQVRQAGRGNRERLEIRTEKRGNRLTLAHAIRGLEESVAYADPKNAGSLTGFHRLFPGGNGTSAIWSWVCKQIPDSAKSSPIGVSLEIVLQTSEKGLLEEDWTQLQHENQSLSSFGWTVSLRNPKSRESGDVELPARPGVLLACLGDESRFGGPRTLNAARLSIQQRIGYGGSVLATARKPEDLLETLKNHTPECVLLAASPSDLPSAKALSQAWGQSPPRLLLLVVPTNSPAKAQALAHRLAAEVPLVILKWCPAGEAEKARSLTGRLLEELIFESSRSDPAWKAWQILGSSCSVWFSGRSLRGTNAVREIRKRALASELLARTVQRDLALAAAYSVLERDQGGVGCLLVYGTSENRARLFARQVEQHFLRKASFPFRSFSVPLEDDSTELTQSLIEQQIEEHLERRDRLKEALNQKTPRGEDGVSLLFFEFGIRVPKSGQKTAETFKKEEFGAWAQVCKDLLAELRPERSRILCLLAVQTRDSDENRVLATYEDEILELADKGTVIKVLPQLDRVSLGELRGFLEEHANLPIDFKIDMAALPSIVRAIHRDHSHGKFDDLVDFFESCVDDPNRWNKYLPGSEGSDTDSVAAQE